MRSSMQRVTSTKSPTRHPRWGETFELPVHLQEHQELVSSGGLAAVCSGWLHVCMPSCLGLPNNNQTPRTLLSHVCHDLHRCTLTVLLK